MMCLADVALFYSNCCTASWRSPTRTKWKLRGGCCIWSDAADDLTQSLLLLLLLLLRLSLSLSLLSCYYCVYCDTNILCRETDIAAAADDASAGRALINSAVHRQSLRPRQRQRRRLLPQFKAAQAARSSRQTFLTPVKRLLARSARFSSVARYWHETCN